MTVLYATRPRGGALAALGLSAVPVHSRGVIPLYLARKRLGGHGHRAAGSRKTQGYQPSADPDQVVYADQSRRLIDRELDESGVTQLGHPLPRILVAYSQAKPKLL